jgi:hypothetical protein
MTLSLDPFSTVARLALLSFMEDGVKIGIVRHTIVYSKDTIIDRALRTLLSLTNSGYSREALYNLRHPLELARRWYDVPFLFELAIDGLHKLQRNYKLVSGNVVDTITFAIYTLQTPSSDTEPMTPTERWLRYNWQKDEINALITWFELLKTPTAQTDQTFIISSIDNYLKGKERDIQLTLTT